MNLIAGVLEEDDGRAVIRVTRRDDSEVSFVVGAFRAAHQPLKSANVLLGIRPESISLDRGDAPEGTSFEAKIDVIEPTGADNLAFFSLGGREVIARLPPGRSIAGERVKLQIDPARALIFDPTSEQRIG
jgi:multiple sugar transport system ATP-binding protein